MEMYDENDEAIMEETVYADVAVNDCDTPAARKLSGFAGHSADNCPCPWCRCTSLDINRRSGYEIQGILLIINFQLTSNLLQVYRLCGEERR